MYVLRLETQERQQTVLKMRASINEFCVSFVAARIGVSIILCFRSVSVFANPSGVFTKLFAQI
jgi:hypothetical protein